jgi:hypothetical protein
VALALTGAKAGRRLRVSEALPIPAWVEPGATATAQFQIGAELDGAIVRLHWRARARYRGGAAPSRQVLEQAARDEAASVAVDRSSGKVTPLPASPGAEAMAEPQSDAAAPGVLEQKTIGARRYELALEAGTENVRTVLRARDAHSGALLWEATIDEGPPRPPKALRA